MSTAKFYLLLLVFIFPLFLNAQNKYVDDILSDGFVRKTIEMPPDYEGAVVVTLVKKMPAKSSNKAILYVHGYNDYFFQREMANRFVDSGYIFYAVDLRRYGRSYLAHQYPFQVRHISEYYADLDSAIAHIQKEGTARIVLMGHSTGGLITSLYCHQNRNNLQVQGLILNSPFLDMNQSWLEENIAIPLASFWGSMFKKTKITGGLSTSYAESLLKEYHGEWTYDTLMKYTNAPPLTTAWMRSIHKGHKKVQRGVQIPCPILVMYSDKSIYGDTWTPAHQTGDAVLDVKDIQKYSLGLGTHLTQKEIPNGLHDLVLSSKPTREMVYKIMFEWLDLEVK